MFQVTCRCSCIARESLFVGGTKVGIEVAGGTAHPVMPERWSGGVLDCSNSGIKC